MTNPDQHPIVVAGFDGSPASHVALARAISRTGASGKLYLVHAWQTPEAWRGRGTSQPYVDRALEQAEEILEAAKDAHPGLGEINWESELIGGPAAKPIAGVAKVRSAGSVGLGA